MVKRILYCAFFLLSFQCVGQQAQQWFSSSPQTNLYSFKCVTDGRTSGDSCDICPSTIIESRSFNGLLVLRDSVPWRWIDQPYSIRVKPGNIVEYWEHGASPYNERLTIALSLTPFTTVQAMADSTFCNGTTPGSYALWYASDSLNTTPIFRSDTMTIVGDAPIYVTLDSISQKYRISIDTTGLGGGGGGGADQTFANSSDATSHTLTLSGPNGSLQYVEGTGIGLSTTGTLLNGILTITNTGDLSATNEAWTIDADDADTELITTQTVKFQGGGIVVTDYIPGTDILTITGTEAFLGTVTSVGLALPTSVFDITVSPITTTGNLTATFDNQSANTVFAGPTSGGAATPAFRALVAADLPAGTNLWTDAGLYTYLTSTTDRAVVGSATELNTSYRFQAAGGAFIQGAGSTSGTYGLIVEKADGTDIISARNDGNVGINNTAPAYKVDVIGDIAIDQPSAYYLGTTKMAYGKPANHNYFFGGAGNVTVTSTKNIGIGTNALLTLGATGGFNTAIGFEAGKLITTGQGNVAIGNQALSTNSTGDNNFAIGSEALKVATGSKNMAVGTLAMQQTTTGDNNTAVGYYALNGNTIGASNTSVGNSSMQFNVDGVSNVAIGESALFTNSTGDRNVSIGRESLYSSTGDDNVAIGRQAGVNLTSGNRNIIIGAAVSAPISTGSNQISIGNVIFATGASGTGTTIAGLVGIKTNSPQRDLHIAGEVRITDLVTDPATLLVGADADGDLSSLNAAAAQTLLGYVDGTGVANRIAYWSDANTLANDAAYTVDAVNDRVTVTGTVAGTGANNAFLNLNSGAISGATEFMRMSGNISGNMLAVMSNANTAAGSSNSIFQNASGGAAGGDPIFQLTVSGVVTSSIGIDNSDGDKLKFTPNASTPGGTADHGIILTNDAVTLVGINKDVPVEELDVNGEVRARHFINTGNLWNNSLCTFGTGAGTGPAINLLSGGNNFYIFEFTTGSAPTANTRIAILTFPDAYPIGPTVSVFSARNTNTATDITKFFVASSSDTALDLQANGTLLANTPYKLMIHTGGRE